MIRALLRRLTTDVNALRSIIRELDASREQLIADRDKRRDEVGALHRANAALSDENTRLRAIAGSTGATASEREVLAVVRAMPGALAKDIGREAFRASQAMALAEHRKESGGAEPGAGWWFTRDAHAADITDACKPLTTLHKKGLVRREAAGRSFRYWTVTT
jgi:hypothetical protein